MGAGIGQCKSSGRVVRYEDGMTGRVLNKAMRPLI